MPGSLGKEREAEGLDGSAGPAIPGPEGVALPELPAVIKFPSVARQGPKNEGSRMSTRPRGARLGIGLPVRNGENYLSEALACLLGQTFTDFWLIIADNASTDRTEEICREAAARDKRVVYIRHPHNIGASGNFNFLFHASPCELFKWAAHDDLMAPTYLERCIALLDEDPAAVVAHSATVEIDPEGRELRRYDQDQLGLLSPSPSQRLRATFRLAYPAMVWGVMRREAVAKTRLFGSYLGSDWNFVGEMVLLGRVALADECLFKVRNHTRAFSFGLQRTSKRERLAWFNPRVKAPALASAVVSSARFAQAALRHPMPLRERAACLAYIAERTATRFRRWSKRPRSRQVTAVSLPQELQAAPSGRVGAVVGAGAESGR